MNIAATRFAAVSRTARAGFAGLAALVTSAVPTGVTGIAGARVKEVELAQTRGVELVAMASLAEEAPLQIVVVSGKRA